MMPFSASLAPVEAQTVRAQHVAVTIRPLTAEERTRFAREGEKVVARDDGTAIQPVRREGFVFLVERRLLPDDFTAARTAALTYLEQNWKPGVSVPLDGEAARGLRNVMAARLGKLDSDRVAFDRVGAAQVHRSGMMVISNGDKRLPMQLDRDPKLREDDYPVGGADRITRTPQDEKALAALAPPESTRAMEALDFNAPETQIRAFGIVMAHLAARWREDEERLRKRFAKLDQAMEDDYRKRCAHAPPEDGTAVAKADPGLRDKIIEQFVAGYQAYGFADAKTAREWASNATIARTAKIEFMGFGTLGVGGQGGIFVQFRLFTP